MSDNTPDLKVDIFAHEEPGSEADYMSFDVLHLFPGLSSHAELRRLAERTFAPDDLQYETVVRRLGYGGGDAREVVALRFCKWHVMFLMMRHSNDTRKQVLLHIVDMHKRLTEAQWALSGALQGAFELGMRSDDAAANTEPHTTH